MRYAIYFTPGPKAVLTSIAAGWLGRNPFTGLAVAASVDWQVPAVRTVWRQGRRAA